MLIQAQREFANFHHVTVADLYKVMESKLVIICEQLGEVMMSH